MDSVCIDMEHTPAKFRFPTLKNQGSKMVPVKSKYLVILCRFPPHTLFKYSAGVCYGSPSRLTEHAKYRTRQVLRASSCCWCDHITRLVSNDSMYCPSYGLNPKTYRIY